LIVHLSTLQKGKEEEGWDLINVEAMCRALLPYRMRSQGHKPRKITADWMRRWHIQTLSKNPLFKERKPETLGYPRCFEVEAAYVPLQRRTESLQAYKKRIYNMVSEIPEMRFARQWP